MILDIVKYNQDPRGFLRKSNIDVINNEHSTKLISDMFETLRYFQNGVGLAAPQVAKNLNLFIVSFGDFEETYINPKIYSFGHSEQMTEGCLSVPDVPITVTRKAKVRIQYHNRKWEYKQQEFDGTIGRIIQHEYDHLIGKLITDY